MNKKKHTQIQRILRLENIVTQLYVKVEALKTIIDKEQIDDEQIELEHQEKVRGVQN